MEINLTPIVSQNQQVFKWNKDEIKSYFEEQLEKYIVEIEMLVQQKEVPPPINGKQCKKCAYYEYCYIQGGEYGDDKIYYVNGRIISER